MQAVLIIGLIWGEDVERMREARGSTHRNENIRNFENLAELLRINLIKERDIRSLGTLSYYGFKRW